MREKHNCPVCKKEIICNVEICKHGVFKGERIIDIWKHKRCKKYFLLTLKINDLSEDLEEYKKRQNKLKKTIGLKECNSI